MRREESPAERRERLEARWQLGWLGCQCGCRPFGRRTDMERAGDRRPFHVTMYEF